jgi:hypothetical protein
VLVALAQAFAYNSQTDHITDTDADAEDEIVDSADEDDASVKSSSAAAAVPEASAVVGPDTVGTMEPGVEEDLDTMIASVQFKTPHEAVKLSTGKRLTRDARNELAAIAVKRAFSECPSLTLLVDALLRYPVHEIHKHCMLTPGNTILNMHIIWIFYCQTSQ